MLSYSSSEKKGVSEIVSNKYSDLVALFQEFLESQKPNIINGILDFTAATPGEQWSSIKIFKVHISVIEPSDWPIS